MIMLKERLRGTLQYILSGHSKKTSSLEVVSKQINIAVYYL